MAFNWWHIHSIVSMLVYYTIQAGFNLHAVTLVGGRGGGGRERDGRERQREGRGVGGRETISLLTFLGDS